MYGMVGLWGASLDRAHRPNGSHAPKVTYMRQDIWKEPLSGLNPFKGDIVNGLR